MHEGLPSAKVNSTCRARSPFWHRFSRAAGDSRLVETHDAIVIHERPDGQWSPAGEDHDPADYVKPVLAEFPVLQSPEAVLNIRGERVRIADELALLSGREMTFGELEAVVAAILQRSKFEHFRRLSPQQVAMRLAEPVSSASAA